MFVFDQLKREDPALRLVAFGVLGGLVILLAGLWWTQIVRYRDYQSNLETQSFRTVRVPAPRGKILDRNGVELANNAPTYNVSMYLEELRSQFQSEYERRIAAARAELKAQREAKEKSLNRKLTKEESKQFSLPYPARLAIGEASRLATAGGLASQVASQLQTPLRFDSLEFSNHYARRLVLPFPILKDLNKEQVARFEERFSGSAGVDLETQTTRVYPLQTTAAHVLGYLCRDNDSREGEEAYYTYRLPDYRGMIGIERGFDNQMRGHAGGKSVLVNNLGYRQSESFWQPTIPGMSVVLTLDVRIQQAAERALRQHGANTRGAIVVLDTRNGDVLALASSPTFNPNYFVQGFPPGEYDRQHDPELTPEINRATQKNYMPGSIFKSVVGMAALENGLNPEAIYQVQPNPANPSRGIYVNTAYRIRKQDTAEPGDYNFVRAFKKSSNSYFIEMGLQPGVLTRIIEIGKRLHLGEGTQLPTRQETGGNFPTPDTIRSGWSPGDTANLCIGQGTIDVTPLQIAIMTAAIANNGTVFWPRLVQRVEPQDPLSTDEPESFPAGRVRDTLGVSTRTLALLRTAMLADVEDGPDSPGGRGTGNAAAVPGFRIGGKTGTAQVWDVRNELDHYNTWFASYGPWDNPHYALVVVVETPPHEGSGGTTCAPLARTVYETIRTIESQSVARAN